MTSQLKAKPWNFDLTRKRKTSRLLSRHETVLMSNFDQFAILCNHFPFSLVVTFLTPYNVLLQ